MPAHHMKHKEEHSHHEKPKKKWMIIAGIFLFLLLVLGYLGIIPVLSDIMGTNKAKDLGIRYTAEDFNSARAKSGVIWEALPAGTPVEDSIQMKGQKQLSTTFTDEELTALANERVWVYYPVKDVQIKINDDGTQEASAKLISSRLVNYALATSMPKYYADIVTKFAILPNPTVYVKGKASFSDGHMTLDAQKLEIWKFSFGDDELLPKIADETENFIDGGIKRTPGLEVKSLSFVDGKMRFDGSLPEVEATLRK